MNYTIICNGTVIAKFLHESDRNFCMEKLQGEFDDCDF